MRHAPLRAYLAEMDPGALDFTQAYMQNFKTKFCDPFDGAEKDQAKRLFRGTAMKPDKMNQKGTVHAEAAMMGLAWAAWTDRAIDGIDSQVLSTLRNDVFQVRLFTGFVMRILTYLP